MPEQLNNVALVGATGNIGRKVLAALLEQNQHSITAITRATSKALFPPAVTVHRGDLKDPAFLRSSLAGQDILVSLVAHDALEDEAQFLEVAKQAGVKVFVPSDFGNPLSDQRFTGAIPSMKRKLEIALRAREAGIIMINVVTSFWIDLMLENDLLEYKFAQRQATLYTDSLAANVSTTNQVALAIARLLALPYSTICKHFEEESDLHISSFLVSQPDIFGMVLKATRTREQDWTIFRQRSEDLLSKGEAGILIDQNDVQAMVDLSLGLTYKYGGPGPVGKHNALLRLPREDLEVVIKQAVQVAESRH
ncbi:hypothetical protein LTR37_020681 [Vermiconidia calcicola]|uniref:Uncharacterized protein n=1 Tax=Vermiconidia calcicola TaxID=1690605 RepID=A0ACC3MAS8_9PEZI|nr:hypothetical protein LTR37_020681 [Vermiconidia calcicola]